MRVLHFRKLTDFRSVKNSGAIWVSLEASPGGQLMTSDDSGANNPNSRYQTVILALTNTTRTSQHTSSQWTTIIGIAAMPGGSICTDPITDHTEQMYQMLQCIINGTMLLLMQLIYLII